MTESRRFAHVERVPIRWGDVDAKGYVNNTTYFRTIDLATQKPRRIGEAMRTKLLGRGAA